MKREETIVISTIHVNLMQEVVKIIIYLLQAKRVLKDYGAKALLK